MVIIPAYIVDAFTDTAFKGNPAAVCILEREASTEWMQNIAKEFNLSETAFVRKTPEGFSLRWFTPDTEVDLCGHATLASYYILRSEGYIPDTDRVCFLTRSGPLYATGNTQITIELPLLSIRQSNIPSNIYPCLNIDNTLQPKSAAFTERKENKWCIIELKHCQDVLDLQPDFAKISQLPYTALVVTAAGPYAIHSNKKNPKRDEYADFISRVFAPRVGIPEDAVTGAAHCCLIDYWHKQTGKKKFTAYQASARGGILQLELNSRLKNSTETHTVQGVKISGTAVTILRGKLSGEDVDINSRERM